MKKNRNLWIWMGIVSASSFQLKAQPHETEKKRNILFIICDDLRPELRCYGQKQIHSPHIDRWAAESVRFNRAYCNIAVSGASRASLLTGLRPTQNTLKLWNARADVDVPDAMTLQECFKQAGYTTIANGKIFHHQDEASISIWDECMAPTPQTPMGYHSSENLELMRRLQETGKGKRGYFYEHGEYPESDYLDWQIAEKSINDLKRLKEKEQPFLLAVGFIRPHLPFVVPQKYWDLYDPDQIKLPANYQLKEGGAIPACALANWSELRAYSGIPDEGPLDEDTAKRMIHGYYASVSFVDAQIGRLLQALKEEGLEQQTTVVLIGDHGWNLGEHGTWCKHSIMNSSLHSTLIIQSPEIKKPYVCNEIVEFVDLYPTLCELAGIESPKHLEGASLAPLLRSTRGKSKGYAVARWNNGFTLIQDHYFYTEWRDAQGVLQESLLFDHAVDEAEDYNVVQDPTNQKRVRRLSKTLLKNRGKRYDN